jgi:hypothetical protein
MLLPLLASTVLAEETNAPAAAAVTSNALPASITIDGTTYEDVRWERVTPTTVTIFHKTGVATIPLEKLPPALQKRFGYDQQKAADYRAVEAVRLQQAANCVVLPRGCVV